MKKTHLLIADKYRHRASTLFAILDVPQHQRHVFYKHMGHSESINQNVYQCPLAIQEIPQIGSFFDNIDNQNLSPEIRDTNDNIEPSSVSIHIDNQNLSPEIRDTNDNIETSSVSIHIDNQNLSPEIRDTNCSIEATSVATQQSTEEDLTQKTSVSKETCKERKSGSNRERSRRYMSWSNEDTLKVKSYFKSAIENLD